MENLFFRTGDQFYELQKHFAVYKHTRGEILYKLEDSVYITVAIYRGCLDTISFAYDRMDKYKLDRIKIIKDILYFLHTYCK
ncbi:hypothetical protein K9M42_02650 [Patescibacteria group bacterium]|nr:hypothetical protein [Patescibacteria group bacterium]